MERKWLWAAPTRTGFSDAATPPAVRQSMGVGDIICGANGVIWGRVIENGDCSWLLDTGRSVKKNKLGIFWRWKALDMDGMPPLQPSALPKPFLGARAEQIQDRIERMRIARTSTARSCDDSEDDLSFPAKSAEETTPCHARRGLVHVKKHSRQGCAIITLTTEDACDYVIKQGWQEWGKWFHRIHGKCCELRRHANKGGEAVLGAVFIGWGHQSEKEEPLSEEDIADYVHGLIVQYVAQSRTGAHSGVSCGGSTGAGSPASAPNSQHSGEALAIGAAQSSEVVSTGRSPHVAAMTAARSASRGPVASRAISATREVLQKRSATQEKLASRQSRRHHRSPSCRGQEHEEHVADVAEQCLEDIVERADLLANLRQAFIEWNLMAQRESGLRAKVSAASPGFNAGSRVHLTCLSAHDNFVWTYQATVISSDFESVELAVDCGKDSEVVDWEMMRKGMFFIRLLSGICQGQCPPPQVQDSLRAVAQHQFRCPDCARDHGELFQACATLHASLALGTTSLCAISDATEQALKMWEQLLVWTTQPASILLSVSEVGYTHDRISNRFRQGEQDPDLDAAVKRGPSGKGVETLVVDLIEGRADLINDARLELDVVFYHGRYRSINNRRLWAFKEYSAHCGHDVEVKVRNIPLIPEVRMPCGRHVLPKFFDANQSKNNGEDVVFRGLKPPSVRRSKISPATASNAQAAKSEPAASWQFLLDGMWQNDSGTQVATVKDGVMMCMFSSSPCPLQIVHRPWPLTCHVDGEKWEGAICDRGDRITWEDGEEWFRMATEPSPSVADSRLLAFKMAAASIRDLNVAVCECVTWLQEHLDLQSGKDFLHRLVSEEKCMLVAFADASQASRAWKIMEEKVVVCPVQVEPVDFDDLSSRAASKAQSLQVFLRAE